MDITLNETRLQVYRNGDVYRRNYNKNRGEYYVKVDNTIDKSCNPYPRVCCKGKMYKLHRIMGYCFLGLDINDPITQIDHIDRDKSNNHINNLRIVSNQENSFNRDAKGYYWEKKRNKYTSQIRVNGKTKRLGSYDTKEQAYNSYLEAKKIYHIISSPQLESDEEESQISETLDN
tara:strand:- start:2323 stop:2847 length:525 start_codon:yes stop_codon:yes gene_type:complete